MELLSSVSIRIAGDTVRVQVFWSNYIILSDADDKWTRDIIKRDIMLLETNLAEISIDFFSILLPKLEIMNLNTIQESQ